MAGIAQLGLPPRLRGESRFKPKCFAGDEHMLRMSETTRKSLLRRADSDRLDHFAKEAEAEYRAGKTRQLVEILDDSFLPAPVCQTAAAYPQAGAEIISTEAAASAVDSLQWDHAGEGSAVNFALIPNPRGRQ